MNTIGIVYDLIFVVILLVAALNGRRRGFASCIVSLAGAVVGLFAAGWAAELLGTAIYQGVIGSAIARGVSEAMAGQGASMLAALQDQLGFLPGDLLASLAAMLQPMAEAAGADLQAGILEALQPVIQPMVIAVVFLVAFVLIRWLFGLAAGALQLVNHIPLLGGANRILGAVLGLATGAIDCWMLCLAIWAAASITGGTVELLSPDVLSSSALYQFFAGFNVFA